LPDLLLPVVGFALLALAGPGRPRRG